MAPQWHACWRSPFPSRSTLHPNIREPLFVWINPTYMNGEILRHSVLTLLDLSMDSSTRSVLPSLFDPFYSRSPLWVFSRLHVSTTWLFRFPIRQLGSTFFKSCAHPAVIFNVSFNEKVGCHSIVSFCLWRCCFLFDFGLSRENFREGGVTDDSSRVAVRVSVSLVLPFLRYRYRLAVFPSFYFTLRAPFPFLRNHFSA